MTPDATGQARQLDVGVQLPTTDGLGVGYEDLRPVAKLAEELQFESVWVGDHFSFNAPVVESIVAATTVAAVTERIRIGFGVLIPALRHPGWVAKQLSSLQVVSSNRVILGVGVGGEFPAEWDAVGVPISERGARTNAFLDSMPGLVSGQTVELGEPWNATVPPLTPHGTVPELWVGGRNDVALRRAIIYGAGWLTVWMHERQIRERIARLGELALEMGLPVPRVGGSFLLHVADNAEDAHAQMAAFMEPIYRIDYEKLRPFAIAGTEAEVVLRLQSLAAAGIGRIVMIPALPNLMEGLPALARVAERLREL